VDATRTLTIEFNDGAQVRYALPVQAKNKAAQQLMLEDFLKGRHLIVECEGRLRMYPVENIRMVEIAGEGTTLEGVKVPMHTLRDAKLLSK
jgi:hypothetical protein